MFAIPTNAFYPSDNPVPIWKETEKGIHLDTLFIYGAFEEKNQNAEVYHNPYFGRPLQGKYMYNDTLGIKESIMLGEQIENQIGRQI